MGIRIEQTKLPFKARQRTAACLLKAGHSMEIKIKADGLSMLYHVKRIQCVRDDAVLGREPLRPARLLHRIQGVFQTTHADTWVGAELFQRNHG